MSTARPRAARFRWLPLPALALGMFFALPSGPLQAGFWAEEIPPPAVICHYTIRKRGVGETTSFNYVYKCLRPHWAAHHPRHRGRVAVRARG